MNNDLIRGAERLGKGTIRRIGRAGGQRVECLAGVLWITQDGDLRDVILETGDAFEFDRGSDALISALADSRFLLFDARATVAAH